SPAQTAPANRLGKAGPRHSQETQTCPCRRSRRSAQCCRHQLAAAAPPLHIGFVNALAAMRSGSRERRAKPIAMWAPLGRKPAKKAKIPAALELRSQVALGHSMIHRTEPGEVRQWQALIVRNGDKMCPGKALEHSFKPRQVDTPVQRRKEWHTFGAQQR